MAGDEMNGDKEPQTRRQPNTPPANTHTCPRMEGVIYGGPFLSSTRVSDDKQGSRAAGSRPRTP